MGAIWSAKTGINNGKNRLCGAVLLMGLLALLPRSAAAQGEDPFAFAAGGGSGEWLSLDAYDEKQAALEEAALHPPEEPAPVVEAPPAPSPVILAEPVRPVNIPVTPMVRAAQAVTVSSTDDERDNFYREQKKWQTVEEADREIDLQLQAENLVSILGRDPFKVRFASLPGAIHAIYDARISKSIADRDAETDKARREEKKKLAENKAKDVAPAPTAKEQKKQQETSAACEAFADYRRRQLEAMESDRQTLSALQSALVELGLSKDLEFMTKPGSGLSSSADATQAPPAPVQTP